MVCKIGILKLAFFSLYKVTVVPGRVGGRVGGREGGRKGGRGSAILKLYLLRHFLFQNCCFVVS